MRAATEEFGPYVVYEQIGLGGMATVHRAETKGIAGFSKQVALKRMLPSVAADAKLVQSFIREARLASHLRHANVAQTYDLGKVGDTYFIAMELVPGRNLLAILKHCAASAGHMPLPIAMNIVNQIADALDYAHNLCDETGAPLGIIHRDVSPSNVIVSEGGIVKLIDFGIAKASAAGMQTRSGAVKGKFSYMAPECLVGEVDARSDLFALGVIAHELLSNRPLFQGKDDMDTLYRVKDMPIHPPSRTNPQVPHEIDAIIMTALERDPEKRWQRATAMRQALTTETQRLGLVAHNSQVEYWLTRAFAAPVHEEDEPSIEVSRQTVQLAQGTVPRDFLADSLETTVKPTGSKPLQAQPADWKVATDVSTIDEKPIILSESTMTDVDAVSVHDKPTVAAPIDPSLSNDWNAPSSVETRNDRPALSEWAVHTSDETREVKQSVIAEHIERSRSPLLDDASRLTPQPPTRSTPPPRATPPSIQSQPPPRATPPQMPVPYDTTPTLQQKPMADSSPTLPQRPSAQMQAQQRASAQMQAQQRASAQMQAQQRASAQMQAQQRASAQMQAQQRPSAQIPAQNRPSAQMPAQKRPSSPPDNEPRTDKRPSASAMNAASDPRTAPRPAHLPPIGAPTSGARTLPDLSRQDDDIATTAINVSKSAVLHEADVRSVIDDLDENSTVAPGTSAARTRAERQPRAFAAGNFLLALLVLIAAGGAAAVVYFALPYLT